MKISQYESSLDGVRQTLRQAGLRATHGRIATLRLLLAATSPLTHSEVVEILSEERTFVDKATIFRNLNDLVDARLLNRTEVGDRVWRFEIVTGDDHDRTSHPHFLCIDCGSVACVLDAQLADDIHSAITAIGEATEVLIRGHCKDCRSKPDEE